MNVFLLILSGNIGAVAHLGERVVRNDEVASSILVSSTILREITPVSWTLFTKITITYLSIILIQILQKFLH